MDPIEELLLECERDSFEYAANIAKKHGTKLVFVENGRLIERDPWSIDFSKIEKIDLDS